MPPTISQQRGMAYAPIPFAVISCISSSYVIYHLLCQERQKLRRLYHRLILAMNMGVLILSSTYAWAAFAVPRGTPHYASALGTTHTCTANGFLWSMFSLTVPIYYASLSLAAYMGKQNIEIPIHIVAWCLPCALSIYPAATDNFNPFGCGCAVAKAPQGCESDPDVPCERGQDIGNFRSIIGFGVIFLYFVFPPAVVSAMYVWLKRLQKKADIGARARHRILQETARQMCLYLFLFWFNILPGLVHFGYQLLSGKILYGLLIFATCVNASQGSVLAGVYFTLEKRGIQVDSAPATAHVSDGVENNSVREGRNNRAQPTGRNERGSETEHLLRFNVFCADPEEDSPWAEFFRDEEDEPPPELPPELQWKPEEGDADKNLDLKTKLYLYEDVLRS